MNTDKVTRFEIINHAPCDFCNGTGRLPTDASKSCHACGGLGSPGRTVYSQDKNLKYEVQLQDDARTMKIFVTERDKNADM